MSLSKAEKKIILAALNPDDASVKAKFVREMDKDDVHHEFFIIKKGNKHLMKLSYTDYFDAMREATGIRDGQDLEG